MKGLIPTTFLAKLEDTQGKPCYEIFDLVAGTSVGGIVAALIASGNTAAQALHFFDKDGTDIFKKKQFMSLDGMFRPRYGADKIEKCLKARLGDNLMSSAKIPLLITSFDLAAYDPFFFRSYGSGMYYKMWEACRATSAAQSYFPAFKLTNKILWDGGSVCNNPSLVALSDAISIWGKGEGYRILSLGCGQTSSKFDPASMANAGALKVALETVSLMIEANDDLPTTVLSQLMGSNYIRVQPECTDFSLDSASKEDIEKLKAAGEECARLNTDVIKQFSTK